ncbi:PspC domain-containing protein [Candidatus Woesearchaeota archaeon]|nr:PspC domain-containing protein [Candidatus Woesearchaeota archaeon]
MARQKRLYISKKNSIIAGVCGGIGEYLGVDPTVIRVLWVLLTLLSMGFGIVAYILAWVIMPEQS